MQSDHYGKLNGTKIAEKPWNMIFQWALNFHEEGFSLQQQTSDDRKFSLAVLSWLTVIKSFWSLNDFY